MKLKQILNIKNIKSFIEGNLNYYYYAIMGLPPHLKEQVYYRLGKCKYDCIPNEACKECSCDPVKKMFVKESCNKGERFPDIMEEEEWEEYKKDNNITIENG